MTFQKAIKFLKGGRKIARNSWMSGKYIFATIDSTVRDQDFNAVSLGVIGGSNFDSSISDTKASDWVAL